MNSRWFRSLISAFIFLCISAAESRAQTISTVIGAGSQGSSGDGGSPTAALLNRPSAVWSDTSGTLFIADTGNNRIRRVNAARDSIVTFAGTGSAAFSGDGKRDQCSAQRASWRLCGQHWGCIHSRYGQSSHTTHRRKRYHYDNCGQRYNRRTLYRRHACHAGHAQRADSRFCARWIYLYRRYGQQPHTAYNCSIDNSGFITTIAGKDTTAGLFIDDTLATQATLNQPHGLYVDRSLNVFIADTNNHRIRKLSASDSVLTTLAGSEKRGGFWRRRSTEQCASGFPDRRGCGHFWHRLYR